MKLKIKKRGVLWLLACIWLLIWLPGCFRRAESLETFYGKDFSLQYQTEDMLECFVGESIVLGPGVYELRTNAESWSGELSVIVVSEGGAYHDVLSNPVTLTAGRESLRHHFWVRDRVSVHLELLETNSDSLHLRSVELWRTNGGNRLVFSVSLMLFAVAGGLLSFRKKVMEGKKSGKGQLCFWGLWICILISFSPLLTDYIYIKGEHINYLKEIGALAESGGMSEKLYLWIPAFLLHLGFPIGTAYKGFLFFLLAATAVSAFFSFYRLASEEVAALAGSMVCLLMPRHLRALYVQGDVGACVGAIFLPMLACGAHWIIKKSNIKNPNTKLLKKQGDGARELLFGGIGLTGAILWVRKWQDVATLCVAVAVTYATKSILDSQRRERKAVLVLLAVSFLLIAIYDLGQIVAEGTPIYLYEVKNLGFH